MECRFSGKVVPGRKLGRRLGFPTANIIVPESAELRDGVYAGRVTTDGSVFNAMINVGHKPSVGTGEDRTLEAHLFGFGGDLYGRTVGVELLLFIRDEHKFPTLEALQKQIDSDRRYILNYFSNIDTNPSN